MTPRPLKQLRILDALHEAYARDGRLPDLAELARRFEIRYPTLREHLAALEAKGHRLLGGPIASGGVPVYGEIAAGLPIGTYPEPEGYLRLPGMGEGFALRVRGDSMADRIEAGDMVLLSPGLPQRSGEICALRVGDDEATLKYLQWTGTQPTHYRLRPHNPAYATLEVPASEVHVDGVFRSLLRGRVVQDLMTEGRGTAP
jgi:repressor LexA